MKKIFVLLSLFVTIIANAATPPAVNQRVLKAFKQNFRSATDVTWHTYTDYYQASFKLDDIQVRAQYSEKGELVKTFRYYGEAHLLPNIVSRIQKKYAGKEIFGVTEMSTSDEVKLEIIVRDDTHFYVVQSDVYGNLDQQQKLTRAD